MTDSNSRIVARTSFRLWAKENHPPKDFVKKYPLPQVARIHEGGREESNPLSALVDLHQPFLLFKSYSSVKVHARSLHVSESAHSGGSTSFTTTITTTSSSSSGGGGGHGGLSSGSGQEVGPTVAIPEDYTGWFAIVSENGRTTQTAKQYTTVEQVAMAQVPFFLVRNDTPAYKLHDLRTSGGKLMYTKTTVKTGHVLKLLGVFEDINSRHQKQIGSKLNGNGGGGGGESNVNTFKYAQCLNYKGEVVFLPFSAKGMFYPTGTKVTRGVDHVYLMSHLLKFMKFPLTVRLVCGFLPKVPCNFTGLLRLTCAKREEIILACTLLKERNVMLEMDMNSGFTLCKALDEERYVKSEMYQSAVAFCADEAEIWRRQMKVMHFVFPESSSSAAPVAATSTFALTSPSKKLGIDHRQQLNPLRHRVSRKSSSQPYIERDHRTETQSVCISMIFDDLDEDDTRSIDRRSSSRKHGQKPTTAAVPTKPAEKTSPVSDKDLNKRKTKFWTLRRLKRLMRSHGGSDSDGDGSRYGMVRTKRTINDWMNDGSENANDEFMTRLPKDVGRSYVKLPGFQIPEDGTYVKSPTQQQQKQQQLPPHPIYDAIT